MKKGNTTTEFVQFMVMQDAVKASLSVKATKRKIELDARITTNSGSHQNIKFTFRAMSAAEILHLKKPKTEGGKYLSSYSLSYSTRCTACLRKRNDPYTVGIGPGNLADLYRMIHSIGTTSLIAELVDVLNRLSCVSNITILEDAISDHKLAEDTSRKVDDLLQTGRRILEECDGLHLWLLDNRQTDHALEILLAEKNRRFLPESRLLVLELMLRSAKKYGDPCEPVEFALKKAKKQAQSPKSEKESS